mgnify:CR=1 FL=1
MGSKKLKKLGKNIEKGVKKVAKSTEKVLKEAALPIAVTLATGGTGAAVANIVASTAVSRQVTKKIKDPVLKSAVGATITGSFSGSQNLVKDVAKASITTKVAQKTKSAALGTIVSSTVCGDYQNITDVTRGAVKEVARENVTKTVAKKTKNQILAQGAGHLVGVGMDSLYDKIDQINSKDNETAPEQILENEQVEELEQQERFLTEENQEPFQEIYSSDEPLLCTNDDLLISDRINDDITFLEKYSNNTSILDSTNKDSVFNISGPKIESKFELLGNYDSGSVKPRIQNTFDSGNTRATVRNDFDSLKVTTMTSDGNNFSQGSSVTYNPNDLRYGYSSKSGNVYSETGVGIDTGKGIFGNEVYTYNTTKTEIKTDIKGACVAKNTYKYDMEVPLCGKIGTISQDTVTCSDSITVTNKVGLNANAAACAVPATKGYKLGRAAIKTAPIVIKNAGKAVGSLAALDGVTIAVGQ